MATTPNEDVKAALHRVLANPLLENARALEAALNALFQKRVFGRINQKASIEAASESDRGVTERLANAFDASLTAARLAAGIAKSDRTLTPRNVAQRFFCLAPEQCEDVVLNGQAAALADRISTFRLSRSTAAEVIAREPTDPLARAFRCLLLNRISRAGIMAPGAGWLNQGEDGRGIRSRWYPKTLSDRITSINALRNKTTFIRRDGLQLLREFTKDPRAMAFVDPPYVVNGRGAGRRLYAHHEVDCDELFKIVKNFCGPMIITYHRSVVVERLARAAGIRHQTITVQTGHTRSKRELIMYKSAA